MTCPAHTVCPRGRQSGSIEPNQRLANDPTPTRKRSHTATASATRWRQAAPLDQVEARRRRAGREPQLAHRCTRPEPSPPARRSSRPSAGEPPCMSAARSSRPTDSPAGMPRPASSAGEPRQRLGARATPPTSFSRAAAGVVVPATGGQRQMGDRASGRAPRCYVSSALRRT